MSLRASQRSRGPACPRRGSAPRRRLVAWASLLAVVVALPTAYAAQPNPDQTLAIEQVKDLSYGDGLFYFFQGENLEALTRLDAYARWGRLPNHGPDTELMLGALYLELGLHNEAGERFERLLGAAVPQGVRNRAWFYLAKVWYARGYDGRAEQAARRLQGALPADLEAERLHLLANVLMRQSRFAEAADLLDGWQGPDLWAAYARFNLGVALIRDNQLDLGARYLDAVGRLDTSNAELLALRDRANTALGFAWLQSGEAERARPVLLRVRLQGPYSSRALLGAGWAALEQGKPREALDPWLELKDRALQDPAVQEAWMAVPYAFARLDAPAQAADNYEAAMVAFDAESARIDAAIARVGSGTLLDSLLEREGRGEGAGWFYQLREVPDQPESAYLFGLMASNDFQEGLKNYRDLAYLDRMLARWTENFPAYSSMIDTRERAFALRLPSADSLLDKQVDVGLRTRRNQIDQQLTEAANAADYARLGTQRQRGQWQRILAAEQALAAAPAGSETAEQRDKLRLIKGALYFELSAAFRASLFAQRRELRDINATLKEATVRTELLRAARDGAPNDTASFRQRIDVSGSRLVELRQRLDRTRQLQRDYLTGLAVRELAAQQERLAAYRLQARFALATIYDRASLPKAAAGAGTPDAAAQPSSREPGQSP